MTNNKYSKDTAIVVTRLTTDLKRRLKIVAAQNNCTINGRVKKYIEKGVKEEERSMKHDEAN